MSHPSHPASPPASTAASAPPAQLHLMAGASTDVGAVRSENQDSFGVLPASAVPARRGEDTAPIPQPALFLVADGMGGHEAGGEASQVAVAAVLGRFGAGFRSDGDLAGPLGAAVEAANAAVWARANAGAFRKMGTTCTVLLLAGGRAVVAHVGDSRAYRVRDGRIEQITTDHTLAEEAKNRPSLAEIVKTRKHHLTRALGVQAEVAVDAGEAGALQPGDRFVLCSDGLEPVPLDEILKTVLRYPAQEAAEWLVTLASARGSRDNATAVVVHVLAPPAHG